LGNLADLVFAVMFRLPILKYIVLFRHVNPILFDMIQISVESRSMRQSDLDPVPGILEILESRPE
jgi:hypothetical protein